MPSRSSIRYLLILLSLGLLLAGLLPDAWAQAPAGQVAPDACVADAQCKELADRGQAEYQAQQYEVALVSLREAYAIQPVSWLLFNIGRIYQKLGRADEALAAYRTFLAQSQAVDEGWQREKARIYVEQIDRERAAQAIAVIPATPPLLAQKPIYQKWWFWIIIGGVTAGVVTGLAVGLTLPQTPPAPPGALVFERTF